MGSQTVEKGGVVVSESPFRGTPECPCPLFITAGDAETIVVHAPARIPVDVVPLQDTIRVKLLAERPAPGVKVTTPDQAAALMRDLEDEAQEVGRVLYLDNRQRVVGVQTLFRGSTDVTILEPSNVIRGAVLAGATRAIVAHNHPSGDPTPSPQDYEAYRLMQQGLAAANLKLADFLVIGRGEYVSMFTGSRSGL
jgi:DNA repair protein RadC